MRKLLKCIIICVFALMILNIASAGYAQDMGKKLCRGAVNILTGWMEIPKNVRETSAEYNPLVGITFGLSKGCGMAVVRTGFGVFDMMTFPFPIPEGYGPILEPEFIFKKSK